MKHGKLTAVDCRTHVARLTFNVVDEGPFTLNEEYVLIPKQKYLDELEELSGQLMLAESFLSDDWEAYQDECEKLNEEN